MSDSILKALMQLFAIIASADSNFLERQAIIKSFLMHELNKNAVNEYLSVFEKFFVAYHHPESSVKKKRKRTAAGSVKILRICNEIKENLSDKQVFIVLIRLFEFLKLDNKVDKQSLEFVETVAESFEIGKGTYNQIKSFTLEKNALNLDFKQVLIISGADRKEIKKSRFKKMSGFMGNLAVLFFSDANLYVIRYFGIHELHLNNQVIRRGKVYVLNPDASIRSQLSKTIYFNDIFKEFNKVGDEVNLLFEAKNLYLRFKDGTVGLHNVSFSETSGNLIGIMGTSGTGKTTLLNVLNGTNKPIHGKVLLNGKDVHENPMELNGLIGHVSQDDYLIEELTVFENLYFNAKLIFNDKDQEYIQNRTRETLQMLGLWNIKSKKVGNALDKRISGGQRKRLNIALELIREPAILFLDEPTSGLSSKDSEIIIDLLKNLASRGKLVFNVIHQPSSDIFKMFDKIYVIDHGGYLIYNGNPTGAIAYFKQEAEHESFDEDICNTCGNVKPEQIFNIIEANVIDEYGNETRTRKITPSEWYEIYKEKIEPKTIKDTKKELKLPKSALKMPTWFKQLGVFFKRDVYAKLSNRQYIIVNLIEAPVLAFMLSYIIKFYDFNSKTGYVLGKNSNFPIYIFIAVIIAIFIGLSVSAQEIIKDKKILKRERFLHLSRSSYLVSKISVMFIISGIQSFSFVVVGNLIMEVPDMILPYWLMLFSTWIFGNLLGLLISDTFASTVTIYITIPFLIIPQLILSGVMVQFDKINPNISHPGHIPWYGEIITSRWAYEALAVYQYKNNKFEKELFAYDKIISKSAFKQNYWVSEMLTKVQQSRNLIQEKQKKSLTKTVRLLNNELRKENSVNNKHKFDNLQLLKPDKYNTQASYKVEEYLNEVKSYYEQLYIRADYLRNKRIRELEKAHGGRNKFVEWKLQYFNKGLERFVKNMNESDKIIEFENKFYRKSEPIYKDPDYGFIKAHFYAPRKKLFGYYLETYWVNLMVIWFMNIVLYILLYLEFLGKLFNFFSKKRYKPARSQLN